jgi:hypothetical protein
MSARPDRVPDWLLERLAAGELPREQADQLRAALRAQGEEARLDALAASNSELLAALPVEQVAREVRRRMGQRKLAPRRPVLALSLAATCAAGLAVVLLVRTPVNPTQTGAGPVAPTENIIIKGDPSLHIQRQTKAGPTPVHDKDRVRRGDNLQLGYVARGARFGVVASIDGRGTVTLHLPEIPGPAAPLTSDGAHALPHSFELDDSPGFERFVFVTSEARFDTGAVTSALAESKPFPAGTKVFQITLTKETP